MLHITSDGTLRGTHILVGNEELRAYSVVVEIDAKNPAKAVITAPVDVLDLNVLEENTQVVVVK